MATLQVRNLTLGAGTPKLFASILGAKAGEVLSQACALRALPVDMAEWRFDGMKASLCGGNGGHTAGGPDASGLSRLLEQLRARLGDMPLLFTYRTDEELAGEVGCPADYVPVLRTALASKNADMIDIELARGMALASDLAAQARAAGTRALLSLHDYRKTPTAEEMVEILLRMEDAGAEAAKIAVTPQGPADVLSILSAMETARERLGIPFAAMGMGRTGLLTRLGGGVFGSAFTFGAAERESATGQPPVKGLRAALRLLYED